MKRRSPAPGEGFISQFAGVAVSARWKRLLKQSDALRDQADGQREGARTGRDPADGSQLRVVLPARLEDRDHRVGHVTAGRMAAQIAPAGGQRLDVVIGLVGGGTGRGGREPREQHQGQADQQHDDGLLRRQARGTGPFPHW